MRHDDLDLALAALPLEEAPSGLHARILAATVEARSATAPPGIAWDALVIGLLAALVVSLAWFVVSEPSLGSRVASTAADALASTGLTSAQTWLWLAAGGSVALLLSTLNVPGPREARGR